MEENCTPPHVGVVICCVREIIPFHKLFLVFFLNRISAEERRSGYEDDNFGCGHGNFTIGRHRFRLQNNLQFFRPTKVRLSNRSPAVCPTVTSSGSRNVWWNGAS